MGLESDRQFPRRTTNLTFLLPDGWKAEVVDVSLSGMKIRSIAFLARNQTLDGRLVIDEGQEIPLKVYVVWSSPPDPAGFVLAEAGLEVVEPPDDYRALLVRLFAEEA